MWRWWSCSIPARRTKRMACLFLCYFLSLSVTASSATKDEKNIIRRNNTAMTRKEISWNIINQQTQYYQALPKILWASSTGSAGCALRDRSVLRAENAHRKALEKERKREDAGGGLFVPSIMWCQDSSTTQITMHSYSLCQWAKEDTWSGQCRVIRWMLSTRKNTEILHEAILQVESGSDILLRKRKNYYPKK